MAQDQLGCHCFRFVRYSIEKHCILNWFLLTSVGIRLQKLICIKHNFNLYTVVSVTNYVKKRFSTYGSRPQFLITNETQVNYTRMLLILFRNSKCSIKQISILLKNKIQCTVM